MFIQKISLKRIINPDGKIKILIPPSPVCIIVAKKVFKIYARKLPAIIGRNVRPLKPESHIKSYEKITEVQAETCACRHAQLFVDISKPELCTIKTAIGLRVLKIPDISGINKKGAF
jgi:hypothetical protein